MDGSTLRIEGTSNKSDWSVAAEEMSGTFELAGSGAELSVVRARFVVPARRITSERGVIMNRLMYTALDVDNHPEVVYELAEVTGRSADQGVVTLQTRGTLSMAGGSQEIQMAVRVKETDGSLHFQGSHELDMTDWGMKPPTAMFGALHTGKVVTVTYDVVAGPAPTGSGD